MTTGREKQQRISKTGINSSSTHQAAELTRGLTRKEKDERIRSKQHRGTGSAGGSSSKQLGGISSSAHEA